MRSRPWRAVRIDDALILQVAAWAEREAEARSRAGLPRRSMAAAVAHLLVVGLGASEAGRETAAERALV